MSRILEGREGVECNIDDVLVHAHTRELHDYRLEKVLERLTNAGVTLNIDKCTFRVPKIKFLGNVVRKKRKDFVQRLIETSKDIKMSDNKDEQAGNPPRVNASALQKPPSRCLRKKKIQPRDCWHTDLPHWLAVIHHQNYLWDGNSEIPSQPSTLFLI